jgi:hypothetical protein
MVLVHHLRQVHPHEVEVFDEFCVAEFGNVGIAEFAVASDRERSKFVVPEIEIASPALDSEALLGERRSPTELRPDVLRAHWPVGSWHVERLRLVIDEPVHLGHRKPVEQHAVSVERLREPPIESIGIELCHHGGLRSRHVRGVLLPGPRCRWCPVGHSSLHRRRIPRRVVVRTYRNLVRAVPVPRPPMALRRRALGQPALGLGGTSTSLPTKSLAANSRWARSISESG